MRVAILADPLDNQKAGVHVYSRELIRAIVKQSSKYKYYIFRLRHDPELKGIEQVVLPAAKYPGYMSLRMFGIIPYMVRKLKIDAVVELAHFGPFNLPRRVKRVTVIHDLTPILFPHFHRFHSQLLQRIFLKKILHRASLVITNSQSTSNDVIKVYGIDEAKIATILLGKDDFYQRIEEKKALEEAKINQPYFHFVGTMEPRKDLLTLLKAFTLFKQKRTSPIQLLIAGAKGWKSEAFYQALEEHPFRDDIRLLGFVSKELLNTLHSHSLAMIYPSIYEGFGFPVLEALCCGGRVICTDNSSLPEVGGALAHYFPTGDAVQLAERMQEVSEQPADEAYRTKAVAWAATFSWTKYASQFEGALEEILEEESK